MDNSYSFWFKTAICITCILLIAKCENRQKCGPLPSSRGYTYPPGDIIIEYNTSKSLEITCTVNDEEFLRNFTNVNISSQLRFQRNKNIIPSNQTEILNATSIKLHIDNPELSNTMYTCILKNDAVCVNNVAVGTKPQPIDDFKCIGYNYENLTCSWTPKENYVFTNYTLTFTIPPSRPGSRPTHCPFLHENANKTNPKMSCTWSMSTEPHYRQAHSEFNFTLDVRNHLGHWVKSFQFDHFKNVLSGPPENLRMVTATTQSLYITWKIPVSMMPFENGLEHRIVYQSSFEPDQWKFGGLIKSGCCEKKRDMFFNLTNLEYAHGLYDIRVSIRVQGAETEEMWSKNATHTAWTTSSIPGAPPKTNIGSFEIVPAVQYQNLSAFQMDYREVFIYWQQLPLELRNGQNFTYHITVDNNNGWYANKVERVELTNAYAKFKNLAIFETYRFSIWSKNSEGLSIQKSIVVVPSQADRIGEPSSFTKTAYSGGVYELTWDKPRHFYYNKLNINIYTLFWCSHDKDRPYQCAGYLNWTEVSAETTVYNISVPENQTTQFAISANSDNSSSGMIWAACTVIYNQAVGKMKDVWIMKVDSDYIDVGWKLDCADRIGSIKGFVIYYCPIVSPKKPECKGSQKNVSIEGDQSVGHGRVGGLTPYVTYMLTVSVRTKSDTYSHQSEPLYNTTFEAAPSRPLELKALNVTNSSVSLVWKPPKNMNGILRKYEIYDDSRHIVTIDIPNEQEKLKTSVTYMLSNLTSYTDYHFSIVACTNQCSLPSSPVLVQTKIGNPGCIGAPKVSFQNQSYFIVKWDKPDQPSGRNDVYEVKITEQLDGQNRSTPVFNVTDTQYGLENCGNEGSYNTFYISVRAVNIENGTRYVGPWSQELQAYCKPGSFMTIIIILVVCGSVVALFFLSRRLYYVCKRMQNVGIKLPDGLDPKNTENVWNSQKTPGEIIHHPPADEELLLDKIGDGRRSGDSSGCSSGQESVSSSLEAGSSLSSTSDSGTEQPRTPTSEERNLRLRNVSTVKPTNSKAYVAMPMDNITPTIWNPKLNSSGNYCVIGVDPNPPMEIDNTYVSIKPQLESTSLPYIPCEPSAKAPKILTADLNKTISTGYIPINKEPEKNPAYVMAGNKNSIMTNLGHHSPTEIIEDKPMYVQVADVNGGLKGVSDLQTSSPKQDILLNKVGGYVSFGDAPSSRIASDTSKSYVPHRRFEAKAQKED